MPPKPDLDGSSGQAVARARQTNHSTSRGAMKIIPLDWAVLSMPPMTSNIHWADPGNWPRQWDSGRAHMWPSFRRDGAVAPPMSCREDRVGNRHRQLRLHRMWVLLGERGIACTASEPRPQRPLMCSHVCAILWLPGSAFLVRPTVAIVACLTRLVLQGTNAGDP